MLCLLWNRTGVNTFLFFKVVKSLVCKQTAAWHLEWVPNKYSFIKQQQQQLWHEGRVTKWEDLLIWGNAWTGAPAWVEYPKEKMGSFRRFIHLAVFLICKYRFPQETKYPVLQHQRKPFAFIKTKCVCYRLLKGGSSSQITNNFTVECDSMINLDTSNEPWLFKMVQLSSNPQSQHLLLPGIKLRLRWDVPASNPFRLSIIRALMASGLPITSKLLWVSWGFCRDSSCGKMDFFFSIQIFLVWQQYYSSPNDILLLFPHRKSAGLLF